MTLKEQAAQVGIPLSTLLYRRSKGRPANWKSISARARELGIPVTTIYGRMKRKCMTVEQALVFRGPRRLTSRSMTDKQMAPRPELVAAHG